MGEMINWMGGWPKEGVISAAEWEERTGRYAELALQWRERDSMKLREALSQAELLPTCGVPSSRILVTSGADAAIDWITKRWLQPGDAVLVERPTSRYALHAFRKAGVVPHPMSGDSSGVDPAALSESIRQLHPRLVYAAPDCTDPEGRAWSPERKEALLQICRKQGVAVLLDERQSLLCEPKPHRNSAVEVDRGEKDAAVVFRMGEFPPGMVAGLRLGWICLEGGEEDIRELLPSPSIQLEQASPAEQLAAIALLEEGIEPIVKTMRFMVSARIGTLTEQLERLRLDGVTWREPQRGLHVWLELPEGLDGDALLRAAWLNGLLFQPGGAFYVSDPDRCKIRVTVAHTEEKWIKAGVQRLADTIADFLGRWS